MNNCVKNFLSIDLDNPTKIIVSNDEDINSIKEIIEKYVYEKFHEQIYITDFYYLEYYISIIYYNEGEYGYVKFEVIDNVSTDDSFDNRYIEAY